MLLTYKKSAELLNAITSLEVDSSVDGAGSTNIKLAYNIGKLEESVKLAIDTRKKVFGEMTGGRDTIKPDDPVAEQVSKRMLEIDDTEIEIKLWKIDYTTLNPSSAKPMLVHVMKDILVNVPELGEPDA